MLTEQDKQWIQVNVVDHFTEISRAMQTELLRGFEAFSGAQVLRIRKVEADQSNLDAALSGRVELVEKRLREIEVRLGERGETK
jgi:hypothetical protein